MRIVASGVFVVMLVLGQVGTVTAGEAVLELTVGDISYVGKAVAHDEHVCWLAHDDGRLTEVPLRKVSNFKKVGKSFKSLSALEARNALREEFGRGWEILGTGHYLVCAKQGRAKAYAAHFESLYRSFRSYFNRRKFDLPEPDFPLIAVVFANDRDFAKQCAADGVPFVRGLKGYYHRKTNRISLFESGDDFVSVEGGQPVLGAFDASIQADLKDTIVHEATHQVAYNLGLHTRVGQPPRWIVEGLATMFEAEGTRQNTSGKHASLRVNEERLWWFGKYREQRREVGSLATFVASEDAFRRNVLNFYAEAWALTFFLAETRPRAYAEYLKTVADRDPLKNYGERERLADFQAAFGKDLARLEVAFLRFIDEL